MPLCFLILSLDDRDFHVLALVIRSVVQPELVVAKLAHLHEVN